MAADEARQPISGRPVPIPLGIRLSIPERRRIIRALSAEGVSVGRLAELFGVSKTTVYRYLGSTTPFKHDLESVMEAGLAWYARHRSCADERGMELVAGARRRVAPSHRGSDRGLRAVPRWLSPSPGTSRATCMAAAQRHRKALPLGQTRRRVCLRGLSASPASGDQAAQTRRRAVRTDTAEPGARVRLPREGVQSVAPAGATRGRRRSDAAHGLVLIPAVRGRSHRLQGGTAPTLRTGPRKRCSSRRVTAVIDAVRDGSSRRWVAFDRSGRRGPS